jgi:hypothetical protein
LHVIYYCYGGTHSSPIAAALHTGLLSPDRLATKAELEALPWFDKVSADQRGKLLLVGRDESGNHVYVCGRGTEKRGITQAIISGFALAGGDPDSLYFVDTLPAVNVLMRIGGYLSRRLHLVWLGRPLAVRGAQLAFPKLVRIVREAQHQLAQIKGARHPR